MDLSGDLRVFGVGFLVLRVGFWSSGWVLRRFEAQFCPRMVQVDLPEGHIPGIHPLTRNIGDLSESDKTTKTDEK